MRPALKLAQLVTVPTAALQAGVDRWTMRRRLLALQRQHGGDWLVREGPKYLVNLSRLRAAHPSLFEARFVGREELESVEERLARVEARTEDVRVRQGALAARVRGLGSPPGPLHAA